jgi:hypothetical protein
MKNMWLRVSQIISRQCILKQPIFFGKTLSKDIKVPTHAFGEYFYLGYCMNVHRVQGSTVDEPNLIYECINMNKNAKYTAVTRATKYENIIIMPSNAPNFPIILIFYAVR